MLNFYYIKLSDLSFIKDRLFNDLGEINDDIYVFDLLEKIYQYEWQGAYDKEWFIICEDNILKEHFRCQSYISKPYKNKDSYLKRLFGREVLYD